MEKDLGNTSCAIKECTKSLHPSSIVLSHEENGDNVKFKIGVRGITKLDKNSYEKAEFYVNLNIKDKKIKHRELFDQLMKQFVGDPELFEIVIDRFDATLPSKIARTISRYLKNIGYTVTRTIFYQWKDEQI